MEIRGMVYYCYTNITYPTALRQDTIEPGVLLGEHRLLPLLSIAWCEVFPLEHVYIYIYNCIYI